MPKIPYDIKNFQEDTLITMAQANKIIEEYSDEGYRLTLRQLYYQFVARDLIPNRQKEYNRLGRIVNDGRMAGVIDWNAIEDRTRNIKYNQHFEDPADVIEAAYHSYKIDMWEPQDVHVEVWIEKDALLGVIEQVCRKLDVTYFSCRGYVSQSEMWNAGQRFSEMFENGKTNVVVLHLGDHDPSGIDMTRDIEERLNLFCRKGHVKVDRIALNRDQIDEFSPPPNPAKVSDSRFESYMMHYGSQSWELDALEPSVISDLIRDNIENYRDESLWEQSKKDLESDKSNLKSLHENFEQIISNLNE